MRKVDKSERISVVAALVHGLTKLMSAEKCLKISMSNFSVFEIVDSSFQTVSGFDWENELGSSEKFDFILGDLPLGMSKRQDYEFGDEKLKIRQNWVEILKSLKFLDENGAALYLVEPTCFGTSEGAKLEGAFNSEGYFVNAIFNAPEGILNPETYITPVFVLITKKKTSSIFLAELLNETQSLEVAKKYYSGTVSNDLIRGIEIEHRTFYGFHRVKIKQQIEKLETQYKEYEEYSIGEIADEINNVEHGKSHVEKTNSVYIPKIGNSPVVAKLSDTTIKHQNYFQVVLGEKAINEYVAAFFKSKLGELVLQSLTSGAVIPQLNKRDLEQATIALPSFYNQEQILVTQRKLSDLKNAIDSFDSELALNPTSSISILSQLDSMLEAIGGLTDLDEVHSIIRQGESKNIEFKETLSLDVKTQTKEKYIELSVLKTIVAFLNTEGGTLLVGVADNSEIKGIDVEIEKFHKNNADKFLLHVKNMIKTRIGEEYYPYIEYKLISVIGKNILSVKCKKSKSPCYLDNAEFYVRTNPATDRLEGPKLVQYIKHHFDQ
ncbi:RNA-binding domain-containing protein [Microcoleus sp. CAWBG640]|uniref:ATP-binding protein n=1 Tax=Microcoleus sp. CAWBG640 TaxID=2841653 RepID=UPI00312B5B23